MRIVLKKGPERSKAEIRHAQEADAEAKQLQRDTKALNRPEMEKYIEQNNPSPAVIAALLHGLQRLRARRPRPDALSRELGEILRLKPEATIDDVMAVLEDRKGLGVIVDFADDGITWRSNTGADTFIPKSNIIKRVGRLKTASKK